MKAKKGLKLYQFKFARKMQNLFGMTDFGCIVCVQFRCSHMFNFVFLDFSIEEFTRLFEMFCYLFNDIIFDLNEIIITIGQMYSCEFWAVRLIHIVNIYSKHLAQSL